MMTERWTKFLLGKGFRFYPVGNRKLSGNDLIGYALLKELPTVVLKAI